MNLQMFWDHGFPLSLLVKPMVRVFSLCHVFFVHGMLEGMRQYKDYWEGAERNQSKSWRVTSKMRHHGQEGPVP